MEILQDPIHAPLHAGLLHVLTGDLESARRTLHEALRQAPGDYRVHAVLTAVRCAFPSFTLPIAGATTLEVAAAAMGRLRAGSAAYWAYAARCMNELALRQCAGADRDACRDLHYDALRAANKALGMCECDVKAWAERCLAKLCLGFPIAAVEDAEYALRFFPNSLALQLCAAASAHACGEPDRLRELSERPKTDSPLQERNVWCQRLSLAMMAIRGSCEEIIPAS